jgi:hypothetical protein
MPARKAETGRQGEPSVQLEVASREAARYEIWLRAVDDPVTDCYP